jgi:hypothetical protein
VELYHAHAFVSSYLRDTTLALNIVRPEIVETPAALIEYKIERKTVTKAITGEIKELKPVIQEAKSKAYLKSRERYEISQQTEEVEHLLRRNTGWRSFLFGKTTSTPPEEIRRKLEAKKAELAAAEAEKQRAYDEAKALKDRKKDLYRSYPGNSDRRLRRLSIFSGSRRKTTIR